MPDCCGYGDFMFALPGYDAFLGFLLTPQRCCLGADHRAAPKVVRVSVSSPTSPVWSHWRGLDPIQHPPLHVCAGLRHLRCGDRFPHPGATNRLGLLAFIEAFIFIAILLVALAYAWRKGASSGASHARKHFPLHCRRSRSSGSQLRPDRCPYGHQRSMGERHPHQPG